MRIAWFVHGRGKGHSVRTLAALPSFDAHDVALFGGGEARVMLAHEPRFTPVEAVVPGASVIVRFPRRLRADLARLESFAPDVVISDGDGPSVFAARTLGVPAIAMSHGLIFGHTALPDGLPRLAILRERINAASASLPASRRIAVHFAALSPTTPGTIVARPDPRPGLARRANDGHLVAYFRDGGGEAWLAHAAAHGHRVRCFGRVRSPIEGVEVHPASVEGFARALESARGVIATAGNHLPAECGELGIPLLALHARGDTEQKMNAHLVVHAGLGESGRIDVVDPAVFARYVSRLGDTVSARRAPPLALPTVTEALVSSLEALRRARSR